MKMIDIAGWLLAGLLAAGLAATRLLDGDVPAVIQPPSASGKAHSTRPSGSDPEVEAQFNDALDLFRASRWSAAYGLLSELAEQGHPDAARIALFMVYYGDRLFGTHWSASAEELAAWKFAASVPINWPDLSGSD